MNTITVRKHKDDSFAFMARVRVMRDSVTYHETETFDRRPAATSWIKKREFAKTGTIIAYKAADPPLERAIDRYTEDTLKEIGRTKPRFSERSRTTLLQRCLAPPSGPKTSLSFFSR